MKSVFGILVFLIFLSFLTLGVYAHPGNTASDGCHYCRTNCDSWGVPWNERHCHNGGGNLPPPVIIQESPTNTPIPLPTNTPVPPTDTPTPLPTDIPTATPTVEAQVLGTEETRTKGSSGGTFLTLALLGGLVYGGYRYIKKRRINKTANTSTNNTV